MASAHLRKEKENKMAALALRPLHDSAHPETRHHEGAIMRFLHHNPILGRARGLFGNGNRVHARTVESGQMLRQGAESLVTGGLLALIHVEAPRGGLDQMRGKLPIDGAVAGLGFVGSWLTAGHESGVSNDLRNTASAALSILAFRKAFAFAAEKKLHSGGAIGGSFGPTAMGAPRPLGMHGDPGEDPIVRAARHL
jgi:hypothetical protein